MSHGAKSLQNVLSTGVVAISGAAPQTIAGNSLQLNKVSAGTLTATVYYKITTNTLVLTPQWEVSLDQNTWEIARPANNAAYVALVTGTGVASTKTVHLEALGFYGELFARLSLVTATGAGGGLGVDECSIAYNYREGRVLFL